MADDMKTIRRKRADSENGDTEAAPSNKVKKLREYKVRPLSKICIADGVFAVGGDVVKLDSKMAKHFMKHDRVAPHVEFDDDGD